MNGEGKMAIEMVCMIQRFLTSSSSQNLTSQVNQLQMA